MIVIAIALPTKPEDRWILEGLSRSTVTLGELGEHQVIFCPPQHAERSIVLPSSRPTLREVIAAIETQTPLRCRICRCGNGTTLLGGSYLMGVGIR